MDLLNHFKYECEQSGTISSATVGNGLPSLLSSNETASEVTASTAAAAASTSTIGTSSSKSFFFSLPFLINFCNLFLFFFLKALLWGFLKTYSLKKLVIFVKNLSLFLKEMASFFRKRLRLQLFWWL